MLGGSHTIPAIFRNSSVRSEEADKRSTRISDAVFVGETERGSKKISRRVFALEQRAFDERNIDGRLQTVGWLGTVLLYETM